MWCLGLGTEFRSEKIPRNRLGTVSGIPRKKALIPRHSEFRGRAYSEARNGTERNGIPRKKFVLWNSSKITYQNDLYVHQKQWKARAMKSSLYYKALIFISESKGLIVNGTFYVCISTERWFLKNFVQCNRSLYPIKTFTFPRKSTL